MCIDIHSLIVELGISVELIQARGLSLSDQAIELEIAEIGEDGRKHFLIPAAAQAYRSMKAEATFEDVDLHIVSAFRSIERQAELIRRKLATGQCIEEVLTVSAPPGYSEHHTGRAVDLSTLGISSLDVEFDQTEAFAWLTCQAINFGFHLSFPAGNPQGYLYEPWHWYYRDDQSQILRVNS